MEHKAQKKNNCSLIFDISRFLTFWLRLYFKKELDWNPNLMRLPFAKIISHMCMERIKIKVVHFEQRPISLYWDYQGLKYKSLHPACNKRSCRMSKNSILWLIPPLQEHKSHAGCLLHWSQNSWLSVTNRVVFSSKVAKELKSKLLRKQKKYGIFCPKRQMYLGSKPNKTNCTGQKWVIAKLQTASTLLESWLVQKPNW